MPRPLLVFVMLLAVPFSWFFTVEQRWLSLGVCVACAGYAAFRLLRA